LKKSDYNVAPLILALVIGPMMENALRQSLMISLGKFDIFYTQPLCRNLFLAGGIIIVAPQLFRVAKRDFQKRRT
jgi:putative tricarboxylic transport membrane protein